MFQKDNFIFKENGMEDEYAEIFKTAKHIFKINGGDKDAIQFMIMLNEEEKKKILDDMQYRLLLLSLQERAVSDLETKYFDEDGNLIRNKKLI